MAQDWRYSLRRNRNQVQKITSSAPTVQHLTPLIFHQTQPHGFHIWANPNSTGVLYLKLADLPMYLLVRRAWSFPQQHWREHLVGWTHVPRLCREKQVWIWFRQHQLNFNIWQSRIRTGWGCWHFGESVWLSVNQRTRPIGSWTWSWYKTLGSFSEQPFIRTAWLKCY